MAKMNFKYWYYRAVFSYFFEKVHAKKGTLADLTRKCSAWGLPDEVIARGYIEKWYLDEAAD